MAYPLFSARLTAGALALGLLSACSDDNALTPPDGVEVGDLKCTQYTLPGASVTPIRTGLLCTLLQGAACGVEDAGKMIDGDPFSNGEVAYRVGLLDPLLQGSAGVKVTLPQAVPAGRLASFDVAVDTGVLAASIGRNVSVRTLMNGEPVETRGTGTLLALEVFNLSSLLGIPLDPDVQRGLVGFVNTAPYNEIELIVSANLLTVDLTSALRVFDVCLNGTDTP